MARTKANSTCGGLIALLCLNVALGGFCFDYCLYSLFGKDIPWYGDGAAGAFTGQFVIPIAIVCWILRLCGVEAPFFGR